VAALCSHSQPQLSSLSFSAPVGLPSCLMPTWGVLWWALGIKVLLINTC
jgi:hypothetical protein